MSARSAWAAAAAAAASLRSAAASAAALPPSPALASCLLAPSRALTLHARRNETLAENLSRKLSGLTRSSLRDVEALRAGTPIFLFNVNDKRLHGVFEAVRFRVARRGRRAQRRATAGGYGSQAHPALFPRTARASSTSCRTRG